MASTNSMSDQRIPLVDMQAEYNEHGDAICDAMKKVVQSGAFILGPQVKQLEQKLATYVQKSSEGAPVHCIAVSDGTTALQMCLLGLGIGRGDEVITVPFTWISSAEVIPLVGATPVFVDVEPDTFLLDAEKLVPLITSRTRAIIAVSLFGLMPDLCRIRAILEAASTRFCSRIALIEDGAQSFGASRQGYRSCGSSFATLSTTSFFPTKPLSCYGDGGAIFTRDQEMAEKLRALRVHGKSDGLHVAIGLNARLDTIQAAVLLYKFGMFDTLIVRRREAAARYTHLLSGDERIVLPLYGCVLGTDPSATCVYGVYTVAIEERDAVMKRLKEVGVGCAIYYAKGCHQQPVFGNGDAITGGRKSWEGLAITEGLCRKVLSLPMHAYLTEAVQIRVVRELRCALDYRNVTSAPMFF